MQAVKNVVARSQKVKHYFSWCIILKFDQEFDSHDTSSCMLLITYHNLHIDLTFSSLPILGNIRVCSKGAPVVSSISLSYDIVLFTSFIQNLPATLHSYLLHPFTIFTMYYRAARRGTSTNIIMQSVTQIVRILHSYMDFVI